jgi:hypothetical protein
MKNETFKTFILFEVIFPINFFVAKKAYYIRSDFFIKFMYV